MHQSTFKSISTLFVVCCLSTVWQTSLEALPPWKHLKPGVDQRPARDKLRLKFPPEPSQYPSDPIESDYDIESLKRSLGEDYVPEYIALTREEVSEKKSNNTLSQEVDFMRKMLIKTMPEEIKNLDFKMPGMKRYLGPKASKKLQLWLWQVSHCSVAQKWKDLGVRYWPHFINVGRCSKKATCSFPSGMKCRVSSTRKVGVLRWHCLDRLAQRNQTSCMWLKFEYPVITECKCACL